MKENHAPAGNFDFIVIGAGSAGCVLARRLSDLSDSRILVLEAGGSALHPALHIPLGVGSVWNDPAYNWSYETEPEAGLGGRQIGLPRGRVLGGSSAINMMVYMRGHRADYDAWAAQGLHDWSADAVLPYFARSETYAGSPNSFRGSHGPMHTLEAVHDDPICASLFEAANAHGMAFNSDYNAWGLEGIGRSQFNIGFGRRQSAWSSFLQPVVRSRGVTLLTQAQVERVLFDGTCARGVVFRRGGVQHTAHARRAVVLCAGAYNSPHLLMCSGIGPGAQLQRFGIDTLVDSPDVGGNLQDHLRVSVEYERALPSSMRRLLRTDRLLLALVQAALLRSGPATEPLASAHMFPRTLPGLPQPDLQVLFRLFHPAMQPWFPGWREAGVDGFGFVVCLTRPKSSGELTLRSGNPFDPPLISHRYLSDEEDLHTLIRGIRLVRSMSRHPAVRPHWRRELSPSEEMVSDCALEEFVREQASTIFHPAGTCRMGVDRRSVVTPRLAVRGTQRLYVVDASVMPSLVSGNINSTVMMIGEKASEYLMADT